MATHTPASQLLPIRTVARLTGVKPVTLRAWERRYGLVKPLRASSGHRLYTREQVDLIHRVLALLDQGIPVSQARQALAEGKTPPTAAGPDDHWTRQRGRMIAAIAQFDEDRLEDLYNEMLALYPLPLVTRRLLVPLLEELGRRWESAEGSVAEEHFFSMYLRNKLGARFHHRPRGNTGPRLLAACLPGEQHELGLLLFALAAHDRGFRLVLLGANTPLEELPVAARRAQAEAIVLSGCSGGDAALPAEALRRLVRAVRPRPVLVGGRVSVAHYDEITAAGAEPLGEDIAAGIKRLQGVLGDRSEHS